MKSVLIVMMMLFLTTSLSAAADGNKLLKNCALIDKEMNNFDESDWLNIGSCLGMVEGVRSTMTILGNEKYDICLPEGGIQNGQAVRIVNKFLNERPEALHEDGTILIIAALINAFPCNY